jgi:hypothetical protein
VKLETTRADEIAIETTKTSKVTAVVKAMSIYSKKDAIRGALNPGMRSLLTKRQKVPISWRIIPGDQENFHGKQEKAGYQRN